MYYSHDKSHSPYISYILCLCDGGCRGGDNDKAINEFVQELKTQTQNYNSSKFRKVLVAQQIKKHLGLTTNPTLKGSIAQVMPDRYAETIIKILYKVETDLPTKDINASYGNSPDSFAVYIKNMVSILHNFNEKGEAAIKDKVDERTLRWLKEAKAAYSQKSFTKEKFSYPDDAYNFYEQRNPSYLKDISDIASKYDDDDISKDGHIHEIIADVLVEKFGYKAHTQINTNKKQRNAYNEIHEAEYSFELVSNKDINTKISIEHKGSRFEKSASNNGILLIYQTPPKSTINPNPSKQLWFVAKLMYNPDVFNDDLIHQYNQNIINIAKGDHSIFSYAPKIKKPENFYFWKNEKDVKFGFELVHAARGELLSKIKVQNENNRLDVQKWVDAYARLFISSLRINKNDILKSTAIIRTDGHPMNWIANKTIKDSYQYSIIDAVDLRESTLAYVILDGLIRGIGQQNFQSIGRWIADFWANLDHGIKTYFPQINLEGKSFIHYCYDLLRAYPNNAVYTDTADFIKSKIQQYSNRNDLMPNNTQKISDYFKTTINDNAFIEKVLKEQ